jgi:hypothetical protein
MRNSMSSKIFLYPYAGPGGKNYIKQLGTLKDIERLKISLSEGMALSFYCDDGDNSGNPDGLYFEGVVHFDPELRSWYVLVDERSYRQASSETKSGPQGGGWTGGR